jgi:uncharacterized paraquat-inducible protein A
MPDVFLVGGMVAYGGVKELANEGMWPVAIIVFTASIAIPAMSVSLLELGSGDIVI